MILNDEDSLNDFHYIIFLLHLYMSRLEMFHYDKQSLGDYEIKRMLNTFERINLYFRREIFYMKEHLGAKHRDLVVYNVKTDGDTEIFPGLTVKEYACKEEDYTVINRVFKYWLELLWEKARSKGVKLKIVNSHTYDSRPVIKNNIIRSAHNRGMAIDVVAEGWTVNLLYETLKSWYPNRKKQKLRFIFVRFPDYVHIGYNYKRLIKARYYNNTFRNYCYSPDDLFTKVPRLSNGPILDVPLRTRLQTLRNSPVHENDQEHHSGS